jgi:competence protein ComEC
MPALGAATFWMNLPPRVEPLRLRRIPLVAAALSFAAGDLLALHWHRPAQLVAATVLLLVLTLLSLRSAPRIAMLPVLALWVAVGCWCAQIQRPVANQQPLQAYADGLSRNVHGSVVRIRSQSPLAPQAADPQPEFSDNAWELDDAPARQSIDLDLSAIEYVTPDIARMVPISGGVRVLLTGAPLPLRCGDLLELPLRLRTPDDYRTPGAFSYAGELLAEGIGAQASARCAAASSPHRRGRPHGCRASSIHPPTVRCRTSPASPGRTPRCSTPCSSAIART